MKSKAHFCTLCKSWLYLTPFFLTLDILRVCLCVCLLSHTFVWLAVNTLLFRWLGKHNYFVNLYNRLILDKIGLLIARWKCRLHENYSRD